MLNHYLNQCSGSRFFSTLDFTQFYHQLPLVDSDKPKTAFYVMDELWQFTRCPFGLTNAVTGCMRVMREVFKGLDGTIIYLDDILVHGRTMEEHDERLEQVFRRIEKHNLSLNPVKCQFTLSEIQYLGHKLFGGQISPDPDRIKPIIDSPHPSNTAELERFLGMINYFRHYIPDCAHLSSPLYEMKKQNVWKWSTQMKQNFAELKSRLEKPLSIYQILKKTWFYGQMPVITV